MKNTLRYVALLLIATAPLHAKPRTRVVSDPNAAQRKAEADARAKANVAAQQKAEEHYKALHPYLPNVTVEELKGMSEADLRDLYAKSYMAQGMKMLEAKEKAASMTLK